MKLTEDELNELIIETKVKQLENGEESLNFEMGKEYIITKTTGDWFSITDIYPNEWDHYKKIYIVASIVPLIEATELTLQAREEKNKLSHDIN